jgi:hypothetical protein
MSFAEAVKKPLVCALLRPSRGAKMKIRFHARKTADGRKEFVCDDCGAIVERNLGEQSDPHQRPYVIFCRTCKQVKGQWLLKSEIEDVLGKMPVS